MKLVVRTGVDACELAASTNTSASFSSKPSEVPRGTVCSSSSGTTSGSMPPPPSCEAPSARASSPNELEGVLAGIQKMAILGEKQLEPLKESKMGSHHHEELSPKKAPPRGGNAEPLEYMTGGELLQSQDKIFALSTKNSRYAHDIDWRNQYWHMAMGGSHSVLLGLHKSGAFNCEGAFAHLLSREQVKSRAENQGGSVSMIFLANTLREIIKKSREILPHCPPILVDGRKRRVAVVDFTPATSHLPRSIRIRPVSDLCRDDEHIFV